MILLQKDSEIGPVSNVFDKYVRSKEKVKNLDKEDQELEDSWRRKYRR